MVAPAIPAIIGAAGWGWRAVQAARAARAAQAAARLAAAADAANTLSQSRTREDTCEDCPCERTLTISRSMSPLAAQHIADAQAAGQPSVLTLDRPGAAARRRASLSGIATAPGMDRDEYPPATFLEGGAGSSVRLIPRSDNRSAGGQMSAQLSGVPEGCQITMTVGP